MDTPIIQTNHGKTKSATVKPFQTTRNSNISIIDILRNKKILPE
jgi:hypothetical protein